MAQVLIAFQCGHFTIITTDEALSSFPPHEIPLPRKIMETHEALNNLLHLPVSDHINLDHSCPRRTCASRSYDQTIKLIEKSISDIWLALQKLTAKLMEYGFRYHNIPFEARRQLSNDEDCQSAHEQFGISKTPWMEDPALQPALKAFDKLEKAENLLSVGMPLSPDRTIKSTLRRINRCRLEVNKLGVFINEVGEGVRKIEKAEKMRKRQVILDHKPHREAYRNAKKDLDELASSESRKQEAREKVYTPPKVPERQWKKSSPLQLRRKAIVTAVKANGINRFEDFEEFFYRR